MHACAVQCVCPINDTNTKLAWCVLPVTPMAGGQTMSVRDSVFSEPLPELRVSRQDCQETLEEYCAWCWWGRLGMINSVVGRRERRLYMRRRYLFSITFHNVPLSLLYTFFQSYPGLQL